MIGCHDQRRQECICLGKTIAHLFFWCHCVVVSLTVLALSFLCCTLTFDFSPPVRALSLFGHLHSGLRLCDDKLNVCCLRGHREVCTVMFVHSLSAMLPPCLRLMHMLLGSCKCVSCSECRNFQTQSFKNLSLLYRLSLTNFSRSQHADVQHILSLFLYF